MCRWVAYAGPEIYLEDLIFHQEHSIVSQSLAATQTAKPSDSDAAHWFKVEERNRVRWTERGSEHFKRQAVYLCKELEINGTADCDQLSIDLTNSVISRFIPSCLPAWFQT